MRKKILRLQLKYGRFRRVRLPRHIHRAKIISRQPSSVPIITFVVLLILTAGIYALARQTNSLPSTLDNRQVIISHDHVQETVPTREKTVGDLLAKLKLQLNQGDVVEPALATVIDQDQFRINIYRAVPVEIIDGSNKLFTFSAATTPRAIAAQAGDKVYPEDLVTVTPNQNFLLVGAIGEQIIIDRATPINVDLYGTPVVLRTHATTIAGLIAEKSIKLDNNDQVVPAVDTPITAGQNIAFIRTGTKVVTVTEVIAMPVQTKADISLAYGTSAVRQQGSSGQQIVTYQIQLQNNIEIGRTIIQKVVTQTPVAEIVAIGSSLSGIKGDMALAGISLNDYQYVDYIISNESGWCPTKWQGEIGYCPPTFELIHSINSGYGYGLGQSTPASNMSSFGSDWQTNPITQLEWANAYAHNHYSGWQEAYTHWRNHHWW